MTSGPATVTVSGSGSSSVLASDTFSRTVAAGSLGSAETGGPWSVSGASAFSVSNGKGTVTLAGAGLGPVAYLNSVSTSAVDIAGTVSLDKIPNAGGAYLGLVGRRNSGGEYRLKIRIGPDRSISVVTVRVSGGTETTLQSVNLAQQYTAGSTLNMRMQVSGVAPTTVRARVWSGGTEPTSWQLSSTDNLSGLQSAGSVGLHAYVSSAATNVGWVLRFDDFVARQI